MTDEVRPPFWAERARRMVGKRLLVAITYVDRSDEVVGLRQFHGVIEDADACRGFAVRLGDGTVEWLPPHPAAFTAAPPGEYRLHSSGDVVWDPDLISAWRVRRPEADGS